jgi:hypothetical protein
MTHIKRTRFASLNASRIACWVIDLGRRIGADRTATPRRRRLGQRPLDPLSVVGLLPLVGPVLLGPVGLEVGPPDAVPLDEAPPDPELPDDELPDPELPEPEPPASELPDPELPAPEPPDPELPDPEPPDVPPPWFQGMWLHAASENASRPAKSTRCCVRFIINSSVIGFTVCVRDDAACHFSKRADSARRSTEAGSA